jgi:hypothetical protein
MQSRLLGEDLHYVDVRFGQTAGSMHVCAGVATAQSYTPEPPLLALLDLETHTLCTKGAGV